MRFFYLVLTLSFGILQAQNLTSREVRETLQLVDTTAIRNRIIYLSDNRLRGRKPGTPGFQMAVDYVIGQFKEIGIEPKGDTGYLQKVIIRTARTDSTGSSVIIAGRKLRHGLEVALNPNMNKATAAGAGDLVWVGFGIQAAHLKHDDYRGIDVKGKVVVVREGAPDSFPAGERAHFNSLLNKGDIAARLGAVGFILLEDDAAGFKQASDNAYKGLTGFVNKDGTVGSGRISVHSGLAFTGVLAPEWGAQLVGSFSSPSRPLGISFKAESKTLYRDLESYNVVGWIPGTDPKLRNEYVIHTAHLDHIGITKPVRGDSINNGAHDNASGTACALEIARLYKKLPPRRSVLIALVTAEEMGLLGSRYLAANPPVPKRAIVADVNTDMPTLIAPLLSIEPLGAEHSSLMKQVKAAAAYLGLEVQPDHMPEQVRFVRSDQYSFIREGIPALHVKYGLKTNDPGFNLRQKIETWTETHYHKPSDEFREADFDFSAAATYVRLNFLIGWQVACETARPKWVKGDFFGQTFSAKQ